MDCTVIVATHGKLANELIETVAMLVGRYEDVRTLDFMPGENVEGLILKMKRVVDAVPGDMPVLFVVDMFSGSRLMHLLTLLSNEKIPGLSQV